MVSVREETMPELPEVETVVRTLRPQVCGRQFAGARLVGKRLRRPWRRQWERVVTGRRVLGLRRRGKWIVFELDGDAALVFHLGMTGRLHVASNRTVRLPHTHLIFPLRPGDQEIRFSDVRRFGSVDVFANSGLEEFFINHRLGPEPFELTAAELYDKLRKTERCLKAVLLDQRVVAGVGNIYADEALFAAKLHPCQPGRRTSTKQAGRLQRAVVRVLRRAIDRNGSTIQNFFYGDGEAGRYQDEFRVYQQTGEPCPSCRTPIERIRLAGRATHYCPACQSHPVIHLSP
jgi:formamidopyrimidine-DNA glycosylase